MFMLGFEFYAVFIVIIFQKENENTFTLLFIFIVKSLQKEQNSTNLLLWPSICWNKSSITPKWFNSLDSNLHSLTLFWSDNIVVFFALTCSSSSQHFRLKQNCFDWKWVYFINSRLTSWKCGVNTGNKRLKKT